MFSQFDKYRNKKGYIILDSIEKELVPFTNYGSRKNKECFLIQNEKYIFKGNNGPLEEIKELMNELIAKQFQIITTEYDIVVYKGKKGVLAKDFSQGKNFKTMLSFLCEINDVQNNIYTYIKAMKFMGVEQELTLQNLKIWLENHILDIFTCQRDRHFKNIAIFEDDFTPIPRYDSSGSFLTLGKYDKINNFVKSPSKQELIEKYGGIRTKLRIFPGSIQENAIEELIKAQYVENDETNIPQIIKRELLSVKKIILQFSQLNFEEIYYQLQDFNIFLNPTYQDYFKMIWDYKMNEYFEKSSKLRG